jgi:hypothetical protein
MYVSAPLRSGPKAAVFLSVSPGLGRRIALSGTVEWLRPALVMPIAAEWSVTFLTVRGLDTCKNRCVDSRKTAAHMVILTVS